MASQMEAWRVLGKVFRNSILYVVRIWISDAAMDWKASFEVEKDSTHYNHSAFTSRSLFWSFVIDWLVNRFWSSGSESLEIFGDLNALGECFPKRTCLKSLNLSFRSCSFTEQSLKSLGECLNKFNFLQSIIVDFTGNYGFTDEGLKNVSEALKRFRSLKTISLCFQGWMIFIMT